MLVHQGIDQFEDVGPCVVMASPGMMQSGLSRELFESWCTEPKNGVIIAGIVSFNSNKILHLTALFFTPSRLLRRRNSC